MARNEIGDKDEAAKAELRSKYRALVPEAEVLIPGPVPGL